MFHEFWQLTVVLIRYAKCHISMGFQAQRAIFYLIVTFIM